MSIELPTLPESWSTTRVDRVASVNARIGWRALTADEYQPEGYAFLSTPNIKSKEIDFKNVNFITEGRYQESPELKLQAGDVLLAKDGNTLGIVNLVRNLPRPATVNGSIAVIRAFGIDPRFLKYVLESQLIQAVINMLKGGMGVPHLFQWDIKRLPIPLPSIDEQRRIADFLDAETARIDRLKDRRLKQLDILDERAYATISEILLPGILTHPSGDPPWPWLPTLDEDRPLVRLGYVCRLQNGITVNAKRSFVSGFVTRPYLRVANVQAGHLDLSSVTEISISKEMAARSTLQRGDVLMTEGGDLDKLGRGTVWNDEIPQCLHQNHVFALRPDPERLDGRYLALLTQTVHGRCYFESTGSKTTNLASTNSNKILSFPVPLPSVQRQQKLVEKVQQNLNRISQHKALLTRQVALLGERRQALITAAVTGQFDVSTASGRGVAD